MTKEQILAHLAAMEWDDDFQQQLERTISRFVVFQKDPDDYHTYCHHYYLTEKEAREDYESRTYVPAGRWCYCIIQSVHDDEVYDSRRIYDPLSSWD